MNRIPATAILIGGMLLIFIAGIMSIIASNLNTDLEKANVRIEGYKSSLQETEGQLEAAHDDLADSELNGAFSSCVWFRAGWDTGFWAMSDLYDTDQFVNDAFTECKAELASKGSSGFIDAWVSDWISKGAQT